MHRKKILLLHTAYQAYDQLIKSVDQYFPSHQHLLVKLSLTLPSPTHLQLQAETVGGESAGKAAQTRKKNFIPSRTLTPSLIVNPMREYEATFQEVVSESQFADLLILEDTLFHTSFCHHKKQTTVGVMLSKVSCPIMVIPKNLLITEQVLLFFDGTTRTFSLIQQFSQDFFQLGASLPTTLLLLQSNPLTSMQERLLIEYLKLNCSDLAVHKISAESQHTLPIAIDFTKCALVVQSRHRQLPDFVAEPLDSLQKVTLLLN